MRWIRYGGALVGAENVMMFMLMFEVCPLGNLNSSLSEKKKRSHGYRYAYVKKENLLIFPLLLCVSLPRSLSLCACLCVFQNHWTLAVVNFRLRRLEYYDSMGQEFGNAGFEVTSGLFALLP